MGSQWLHFLESQTSIEAHSDSEPILLVSFLLFLSRFGSFFFLVGVGVVERKRKQNREGAGLVQRRSSNRSNDETSVFFFFFDIFFWRKKTEIDFLFVAKESTLIGNTTFKVSLDSIEVVLHFCFVFFFSRSDLTDGRRGRRSLFRSLLFFFPFRSATVTSTVDVSAVDRIDPVVSLRNHPGEERRIKKKEKIKVAPPIDSALRNPKGRSKKVALKKTTTTNPIDIVFFFKNVISEAVHRPMKLGSIDKKMLDGRNFVCFLIPVHIKRSPLSTGTLRNIKEKDSIWFSINYFMHFMAAMRNESLSALSGGHCPQ